MKQPRGIRNNNPLNIRKGSAWVGLADVQDDPAFCKFKTMQYGIRAAFKLMSNHITGFGGSRPPRNTIAKLIRVWAPPSENATAIYINFVADFCDMNPSDIINPLNGAIMCRIARAMAFVENGMWLDEDLFQSAWFII